MMKKRLSDLCDAVPASEQADAQKVIDQYRGKSESELLDALKAVTQEEQQKGNLDNIHMDEIYDKLAPMLTDAQKEKMRQVIRKLKE